MYCYCNCSSNFIFIADHMKFLVVQSIPRVVGHFDNLATAKARLRQISDGSRLIAEVGENGRPIAEIHEDGKFKNDPENVGGYEQTEKNGFNKKWYVMGDVINMIRACERHLQEVDNGK